MPRACPDCRQSLTVETHYHVDVDRCADCAGVWFDASELRRMLAADPLAMLALEERILPHITQQQADESSRSMRNCPACEGLLRLYHYAYDSPIDLDACDSCGGVWVQEGELQKMQQWRDRHATPTDEEKRRLALAQVGIEHGNAVSRMEGIRWFCDVLRQHRPLWWDSKG